MKRRRLLEVVVAVGLGHSGCISISKSNASTTLSPVTDPPSWLQREEECPEEEQIAELHLSYKFEEVSNAAVVRYSELSNTSRLIVRFAVANQGAVTCSNGRPFSDLQYVLGSEAVDSYVETHGVRPEGVFIRFGNHYRKVAYFRVLDGVMK